MNMNEQKESLLQSTNNDQQVIHSSQRITFSGPLPPPNVLEYYEKILPGSAERILKMAEEQSRHRRSLEEKVINSDISNSKHGLLFGFFIGIVAFSTTILLAYFGYPISGVIVGLGYITSLVGVFVYGSKSRKQERLERQQSKERDR